MKIRTLIIDDEPYSRRRQKRLLLREPAFEWIGEAVDGEEASVLITNLKPELLLLDVQMPGKDGFEVLQSIPRPECPQIIFVTAFDEFALKAFAVHAVDYLLKPFEEVRFYAALARVRQWMERGEPPPYSALAAYAANHRTALALVDDRPFSVKCDGMTHFIRPGEIMYLESEGNYVRIVTRTETRLCRQSLQSFFGHLPSGQFARIHRSIIVNAREIKSFEPQFHGDGVLLLRNGTKIPLSRTFRTNLEHILGSGF